VRGWWSGEGEEEGRMGERKRGKRGRERGEAWGSGKGGEVGLSMGCRSDCGGFLGEKDGSGKGELTTVDCTGGRRGGGADVLYGKPSRVGNAENATRNLRGEATKNSYGEEYLEGAA